MKYKIVTIVGTRPEIIKLSQIIKKLDVHFNHIFVHTGQNWDHDLKNVFIENFDLRNPDYYLNVVGENLGSTMGNIISSSFSLLQEIKPDALLILGDTNSALCALPAKRLKIPVFHMEAGNRCFDDNLPEEINRRIIDHMSDINLCYTEHARRNLINEGILSDRIFVIGSPMREILVSNHTSIMSSDVLSRLSLEPNHYFVVSIHREDNIDNPKNFIGIMNAINKIADMYRIPVIFSIHPRSKKALDKHGFVFRNNVISHKPFDFFDYMFLQINSLCVISDSGTLSEEAAFYKFSAVSIRTSTERPEGIDSGNFIIAGVKENQILNSIELAVSLHQKQAIGADVLNYMDQNISAKVVMLIQGYIEIINQNTWRKT